MEHDKEGLPLLDSYQNGDEIFFSYVNAKGEVSGHHINSISFSSLGHLQGYSTSSRGFRTFRQDRVLATFGGIDELELWLGDKANLVAPAIVSDPACQRFDGNAPSHPHTFEICFTGFGANERKALEQMAEQANMAVKKSVTRSLEILCCGPNAGPKKMHDARNKGCLIIGANQLKALIDTGELPIQDDTDEHKAEQVSDAVSATFRTMRSLPRRECLIAMFKDGIAAGWAFAVGEHFRDALDIKLTPITHESHAYQTWTQGHAFDFKRGDMVHSHPLPDGRVITLQVLFTSPAGFETVSTVEGSFTGTFLPVDKKIPLEVDSIPIQLDSQRYDPGILTVGVFDGNKQIMTLAITQVEFVGLLQTGYFWEKLSGSPPVLVELLK